VPDADTVPVMLTDTLRQVIAPPLSAETPGAVVFDETNAVSVPLQPVVELTTKVYIPGVVTTGLTYSYSGPSSYRLHHLYQNCQAALPMYSYR